MMALLVFKERLRVLYGKYAAYIDTAIHFLLSFAVLMAIDRILPDIVIAVSACPGLLGLLEPHMMA